MKDKSRNEKNIMNEIKIGRKKYRSKGKRKQKERTLGRYKYIIITSKNNGKNFLNERKKETGRKKKDRNEIFERKNGRNGNFGKKEK